VLTVGGTHLIAVNPYYHYILIIKLLGEVAANMTKQRVKCDINGYLYYDSQAGGKIYVGKRGMVNEDKFIIERKKSEKADLENEYMRTIWGRSNKPRCAFCNGYGVWPEDSAPINSDELDWALADDCPECGSNNHAEYIQATGGCGVAPPWDTESIGFHVALERFKRSASCVASSDTQAVKTAQK